MSACLPERCATKPTRPGGTLTSHPQAQCCSNSLVSSVNWGFVCHTPDNLEAASVADVVGKLLDLGGQGGPHSLVVSTSQLGGEAGGTGRAGGWQG
jgi:hypothetical protein